jgi:hypothetical protein
MREDTPVRYEYELLEGLLALELEVLETKKTEFGGTVHSAVVGAGEARQGFAHG